MKSASSDSGKEYSELLVSESHLKFTRFYKLKQLYNFLDAGMERIRLKLETPIVIAERLLSACETLVNQDCQYAKQDLTSATEIIDSVKEHATEMENEHLMEEKNYAGKFSRKDVYYSQSNSHY